MLAREHRDWNPAWSLGWRAHVTTTTYTYTYTRERGAHSLFGSLEPGDNEISQSNSSPEWIRGAMSTDELLFAEQATTSLYERIDDPDEQYVLSLSQAKVSYGTLNDVVIRENGSQQGGAPEIVVQIRKRNGQIDLLIDGYVSTGRPVENEYGQVTRHDLLLHNGLYEDIETGSRVFSPMAVVAAVEDGQHPLQGVTVSVVHSYANHGDAMDPAIVLSEARIRDHRVSDVRCDVVRVPYPLSYPCPPTVAMYDDAQKRKYIAAKSAAGEFSSRVLGATTAAGILAGLTFTVTPFVVTAGMAAATGLSAYLFSRGANVSYRHGWELTSLTILSFLEKGAGALPFVFVAVSTQQYSLLVAPFVIHTKDAISKYLRIKDPPALRRTTFTIAELARVIESLCILRGPNPNGGDAPEDLPDEAAKIPNGVDQDHYKKETIVWNWLEQDEGNNDDDGKLIDRLDLKKMVASAEHAAQLHVRISVDDSLACDAKPHHHELHCGREDSEVLAAAAAGTLDELTRLYAAIDKLKKVLTDAIAADANAHNLWVDREYWNKVHYIVALGVKAGGEAANVAWNAANFRAKGALTRYKKNLMKGWIKDAETDPSQVQRKEQLERALKRLMTSLYVSFFGPGSPGATLYMGMQSSLNDRRLVRSVNPPVAWIRKLPQRADASYASYLFSAVRDSGTEHFDVSIGSVVARVFGEYKDASAWLSACMKSSRLALKRLVPEWESNSNMRMRLLCMCTSVVTDRPRYVPPIACSTLALATPIDILFASVLAAPTEHSQRRIRFLVQRARPKDDKGAHASVLEALGLEHSDAFLLACQVFGDLWVDELTALYALANSQQAEMLEMASTRAAARLSAAGTHLLALVSDKRPPTDVGAFSDVALNATDVALIATQAGRDAGLIVSRLLFRHNLIAARSIVISVMRAAARAAVRTAAVFTRIAPTTLPHEACASLFGDRLDGIAAFARVRKLTPNPILLEAAAAAYPSVHLLQLSTVTEDQEALVALASGRPAPQPPNATHRSTTDLVRAMRFRLASLRMDFQPIDVVATTDSVDELATRLSAARWWSTSKHVSFYVPFGFGDARPPPTLPPCSAPLFGTVPVYGSALVSAFRSISTAGTQPAPAAKSFNIRLEPTFDCLKPPVKNHGSGETESVHPNVVQVLDKGPNESRPVYVVRYTASRTPPRAETALPNDDERAYRPTDAARAAKAHRSSAESSSLALRVSSLAWNAERVVQAVVAALASADDEIDYDSVSLTLVLPQSDARATHWYNKPPNPMTIAQRTRDAERTTKLHDAMLAVGVGQQSAAIEALLTHLRAFDSTAGPLGTQERVDLLATINRPRDANESDHDLIERRRVAFETLFDDALLEELRSTSQAAYDAFVAENPEPDPLDYSTIAYNRRKAQHDAQKAGYLVGNSENVQKLINLMSAVENLRLSRYHGRVEAARRAQQASAPGGSGGPASTTDERNRALVAALGVGMAMLTPQIADLSVECHSIEPADQMELAYQAGLVNALATTFANCEAVRFGEACLVASGAVYQ